MKYEFFKDKKILITGGTGSLGQSLTKRLLDEDVESIRIFSRNESLQINMENKFQDDRLRFLLGDIRDKERLSTACEDVNIVFHTAALKHVPIIEYNPFESIKTNIIGSQNIIDACLSNNVEKAVCVSTDKAVSPLNTYGATKLIMEKLFVTANNYLNPKNHPTKFFALRYGNVMASSGSVIPKFIQQLKAKEKITMTDPKMTRFSILMEDALEFILKAVNFAKGSEVFLPKMKAYSILDVKAALTEMIGDYGEEITGIRPGEKLHETLINKDEIRYGWEYNDMFMLTTPLYEKFYPKKINEEYKGIKKIDLEEDYSSNNVEKITKNELVKIFEKLNLF